MYQGRRARPSLLGAGKGLVAATTIRVGVRRSGDNGRNCDRITAREVHLLNTTAWLLTLHREGLLPEGLELVEEINSARATPLLPFEKTGLSKRVRSSWLRRSFER